VAVQAVRLVFFVTSFGCLENLEAQIAKHSAKTCKSKVLGCLSYIDIDDSFDTTIFLQNLPIMTNQYCAALCGNMVNFDSDFPFGFGVSATTNNGSCGCIYYSSPDFASTPKNSCSQRCLGDSRQSCGSADGNYITVSNTQLGCYFDNYDNKY